MGAGAGIGGNVARRFAQEGYHAVLCRRSDLEGLNKLVDAIKEDGGSANGLSPQCRRAEQHRRARCRDRSGHRSDRSRGLQPGSADRRSGVERHVSQSLRDRLAHRHVRSLSARLCGVSGDGRARQRDDSRDVVDRGDARQRRPTFPRCRDGRTTHAVPVAQRGVCVEGHSRRAHRDRRGGRRARHVGKNARPRAFQQLRETRGNEHDGLMLPAKIAETYLHLARQHRSTWTFELDLRAFSDRAWWNH